MYGEGLTTGPGKKPQLLEKIENWKNGVVVAKGTRTRHVLPAFIDRHLADTISTQGRHGITWLPQNVEIIPMDHQTFQRSYRVVRRVIIRGASFIPDWIEFAGKTMKAKDSLKNCKERSVEALTCPMDHPGVIKIQYLNMRTYESYSLWWNGGTSGITTSLWLKRIQKKSFFTLDRILNRGNDWWCIGRIELIWHGI